MPMLVEDSPLTLDYALKEYFVKEGCKPRLRKNKLG
jgi:hypothetical protein